jgi:hypothetical protein
VPREFLQVPQIPIQSEINGILLQAIWQQNGAGQQQWVQQVKDSMGGWVSGEERPVYYQRGTLYGTLSLQNPAPGGGGGILLTIVEN